MIDNVTCIGCASGNCDWHCADCGAPVEPDTSGPATYWPLCCDECFEKTAEARMRAHYEWIAEQHAEAQ